MIAKAFYGVCVEDMISVYQIDDHDVSVRCMPTVLQRIIEGMRAETQKVYQHNENLRYHGYQMEGRYRIIPSDTVRSLNPATYSCLNLEGVDVRKTIRESAMCFVVKLDKFCRMMTKGIIKQ